MIWLIACYSFLSPLTKALYVCEQIYAPLDDDVTHDAAFHRTMFLFTTPQVVLPSAIRFFHEKRTRPLPPQRHVTHAH